MVTRAARSRKALAATPIRKTLAAAARSVGPCASSSRATVGVK